MKLKEDAIKEVLSDVYDPEIHVDIVSLGLVYDIKISEENDVKVLVTFTFPGCPYGQNIVEDIEDKLKEIEGVRNISVEVTFDPPWSPEKIDPDVRAALNL